MADKSLVTLDTIALDKDDVLAIAVSRAEAMLVATRKEQDGLAKGIDAEIARRTKAVETQAIADAQVEYGPKVQALADAAKAIGAPAIESSYTPRLELTAQQGGPVVMAVVSYKSNQSYHHQTELASTAYPLSASLLAELEAIEGLKKDLAVHRGLALDARKRLTEIPMLERQWKGRLAESRLAQVEGGQEVIDLLTKDLAETVLALPGI